MMVAFNESNLRRDLGRGPSYLGGPQTRAKDNAKVKNEEDSSAQVADPEEHAQVQTALQRQTHFRTYYSGMVSVIENALVATDPDTEEIIYRCNGGAVVEILFASSTSQAQMKLLI